jgi:hypothetical protein
VAVAGLPALVALGALASPRWYPVLDWAWIEMRVRDVGTSHTPLVGLLGRLDGLGVPGSHPGPLLFYALAPLYRLLGASPWALLASSAVLNVAAVATGVWVAHRRGGLPLALGVGAVSGVLVHAYGAERLVVPWLPWSASLWWFVFLLAAWSVLCGDHRLLAVAVATGSFCVQTHVGYAGLVGGMGLGLALWLGVGAIRRRRAEEAAPSGLGRSLVVAGAVGVVVWLPPLLDELVNDPGNLSVLWDHFTDAPEAAVGASGALPAFWAHLDPGALVLGHQRVDGSPWPGAVLLAAWLATVVLAWRDRAEPGAAGSLGRGDLLALHAVVAAALGLGLVSMSRVLGPLWDYLVLWAWGTTALLLVAVGATAARWWATRASPAARAGRVAGRVPLAAAACAAVVLVAGVATTVEAAQVDGPHPGLSRSLAEMMPAVVAGLPRDGRYFVSWEGEFSDAMAGYSLLLELERAGYTAGVDPPYRYTVRPHRILERANAAVVYVTGDDNIARAKARPGAVEAAHYDPPPAHTRELARLRDEVAAALESGEGARLRPLLDDNLYLLATQGALPADLLPPLQRMLDLSVPASVIVQPIT